MSHLTSFIKSSIKIKLQDKSETQFSSLLKILKERESERERASG